MPKAKTPSFVTELPLRVTPGQEVALNKRFEAARQVYNACLGESLKRFDLMRQSKAWQAARKMPRGDKKSKNPKRREQARARAKAYQDARKTFGFSSYLPMPAGFTVTRNGKQKAVKFFATTFTNTWVCDHIGTRVVNKILSRAFGAVEQYSLNVRGRPRFKRKDELNSVEGETNAGIRWRDDKIVWQAKYGGKLQLQMIIDSENPVQQHGLSSRVKYIRLLRRRLSGRIRFYAQLVNEGLPYERVEIGQGVVGLDIGPSTVAGVSDDEAFLFQFCAELENRQKQIAKLQRKIDRQRRTSNPDNYEADWWEKKSGGKTWVHKRGKIRKGPKTWVKSNRQKRNEVKLAELQRKQAAHRKSLHGRLVNRIIGMGNVIKLEKLSYKAFQRIFGKSVGMRAPGMFVARLRQKAQAGLIDIDEFSTFTTKLSQLDHKTGEYKKKPLSQRWHYFDDGEKVQRDLYSAFLATCVEDDTFNAVLANERWAAGVGTLLQAALNDIETGDAAALPSSFGLGRSQSRSPVSKNELS